MLAGSWRAAMCVLALLAASMLVMSACAPVADAIDRSLNPVASPKPAPVSTAHAALHAELFVADLHADTLMWDRDLLARGAWGHVDIPRLRSGGVDMQVFTVVTKTPGERPRAVPGLTDGHCVPADGQNTTGLLAIVQGRPIATWGDLRARALYQARRLDEAVARSLISGGTELLPVRTAADLARLVRLTRDGDVVGAVLGLEGANWIGGPGVSDEAVRAEVRLLFNAGFRSFAPTHRFDNALAGSSEGCAAYGLTMQGATAIDEAERLGMVIDLAHISPIALRDVLPRLHRPPWVSHTGIQDDCQAPCYGPRNLADAALVAIARRGGVIGIGFWPEAVGSGGMAAIVHAFARAAAVLREAGLDPWDHLAFGSDFDGAVEVPFDAASLPALTAALLAGDGAAPPVPADALPRLAGANACRVLALALPGGGAAEARAICDSLRRLPRL